MNEDFPADIKQFIADHVDSVAQLELLLLLRADPGRDWTADEAGRDLYSAPDVTALQLADLQARAFVTGGPRPDSFRFHPQTAEQDQLLARLADLYRDRRVAVITAIYSKPVDKIRSFADAFRLRKEK